LLSGYRYGDNANTVLAWYAACEDLPMRPYFQKSYVASYTEPKTFEENLLSMDAIVVGGGNTLNLMAIWKAQGIDTVLRKAYNKGIILSGAVRALYAGSRAAPPIQGQKNSP